MIPKRNLKKGRGRPSEGPYMCTDCGILFPLKAPFLRHQAKECTMRPPRVLQKRGPKVKKPPEIKEKIHEVFINSLPYATVRQRPQISSLEKKYPCDRCGRRYVNHRDLLRHKRYICGQEPLFKCRFCSRKFYHRYLLSRHEFNFHQM